MIEIDPEITVGKDNVLVKIGMVMNIEEMGILKILAEIMTEIEAEILSETITVTGVDQEKEGYHPEGIIITIIIPGKTQILDSDLGIGVDPTQE